MLLLPGKPTVALSGTLSHLGRAGAGEHRAASSEFREEDREEGDEMRT